MKRYRWGLSVCLAATLFFTPLLPTVPIPARPAPQPGQAPASKQLASKIETVVNGEDYRQAHWGILVVDSKTGEVVYVLNGQHLFLPASVTKIFSVAAALLALGVDYCFETPVYRRGELLGTRLRGDLILVASGDVTMGGRNDAKGNMVFQNHDHTYANSITGKAEVTNTDPLAGLKALAKQVKEAGINYVQGDVLVDDRLFERSPSTGSGPTIVSPIVINDNVVDVIVTPGAKAGEPAKVQLRPETTYVQMDAVVTTTPEKIPTHLEIKHVGGERFTVRGSIALKAKPAVRIYPVQDPPAYARALFIETLRREGVAVAASPLATTKAELPERESYAKMKRVARFTSPPFSEVAKVTLKVSHNLYASTLPLLIAAKYGKRTLPEGLQLQGQILSKLGVDVKTISFGGGAGGAGADQVTPAAAVALLRALANRPEYKAFEAGLPVLGVDGTLADVIATTSPARGAVRAKTGTYSWHDLMNDRALLTSKALAGTMVTARGRRLTFAIFVNNVPLPRGVQPAREGRVLAQLCEIIHQHAP
jgi:D-alanyl-D-alanine carboxypeptidase/D-alanyl-D-alanine-endopeptidase (penicillin-binding protein 4)